jgi:hypothetical protein
MRFFAQREPRLKVCRMIADRGGYTEDAVIALGNTVTVGALRAWLKIHDPGTLARLAVRKQGGPTIKGARAKARIALCERIALSGGGLEQASAEMGTITPNGLYCWLRKYAPATFRRICRKKGGVGENLSIPDRVSARRVKMIHELGYAGAARRLRTNRQALYSWLKYRISIGNVPDHMRPAPRASSKRHRAA